MSKVIEKIGQGFKACDWFAAPVLLRYQGEENNKTKTGGFVSLILIIALISVFSSSWVGVLKKTDIKSQSEIIREMNPSAFQLNNDNFAIAVGLANISLLNSNKFFDISFVIEKRQNGRIVQTLPINMVNCQISHFHKFDIDYQQIYAKYGLENFLCLPDNFSMNLQGKFVSQTFNLLTITISNCTSNCVSTEQIQNYIDTYGGLQLKYYLVNKLINPTLQQPLSEYFEDKYYHIINGQNCIDTNLYVSQYDIETDESLWPFSDISSINGIYIDRTSKEDFIHTVQEGVFARFYIRKSDQKLKVVRSYRKLDDMLSYLGGLFGLMAAAFGFLLNHYNKCCFQVQLSTKIFKKETQNDEQKKSEDDITALREAVHCNKGTLRKTAEQEKDTSFNLWTYFKYLISKLLFVFVEPNSWPAMQSINQKIQETQSQMNIDLILQKISFCQRAFQCIFSENEMTLLMLQQKISIQELKRQRLIMNMEDQTFLSKKTKQNKQQEKEKPKQNETSSFNIRQEEDEVMVNIYEAIFSVQKMAKRGDITSIKILQGLRADVEQKYKMYSKNFKGLVRPQRASVLSKFTHRNSRRVQNTLFNDLQINQLHLIKPKIKLDKIQRDEVRSSTSVQLYNLMKSPFNQL